jgi:hypothetical protein
MAAAMRLSQQHSCSLDHLVRVGEDRKREFDAERLGDLEVDQLNGSNSRGFDCSRGYYRLLLKADQQLGGQPAIRATLNAARHLAHY